MRPTTVPIDPTNRGDPQTFLYGFSSALAITAEAEGMPQPVLPPRPHSPAARRVQVREAISAMADELDAVLSRKQMRPSGFHPAHLGRLAVSNAEVVDNASGTYTAGPGLDALITVLKAMHRDNMKGPK